MLRVVLRKLLAVAITSLGLFLLYAAWWVVSETIWPQVRESGWSVSGESMILNRVWSGNEIYILVSLYVVFGLGAAAGGVLLWKRPKRI